MRRPLHAERDMEVVYAFSLVALTGQLTPELFAVDSGSM